MSRSVGTWGEAQVANYLRQRKFRLVAHSYRCRFGEIDLIAMDGNTLCFVEVKTRSNLAVGLPRDYVTAAKRERIRKTALFFSARKIWTARYALMWRRSIGVLTAAWHA